MISVVWSKASHKSGILPNGCKSEAESSQSRALEDNFAALEEEDESSAEELHELIEREKNDFISVDQYLKRWYELRTKSLLRFNINLVLTLYMRSS